MHRLRDLYYSTYRTDYTAVHNKSTIVDIPSDILYRQDRLLRTSPGYNRSSGLGMTGLVTKTTELDYSTSTPPVPQGSRTVSSRLRLVFI
jgi:hypothetical protein